LHPNLLLSEVNVSMPIDHEQMRALDDAQVKRFIKYGFIRLDHAFPRELADEGRELLWRDTGCDPHDPATWTQPVGKVRDAETSQPIESVIMALHHANNPINAMGVSLVFSQNWSIYGQSERPRPRFVKAASLARE